MDCIGYKIYTDATVEPVTLSEMKAYIGLDVTASNDDDKLGGMISSARVHLERVTGRIFCTSIYDVQFKSFSDIELKLPFTPIQSVSSITYKISGVSYTLAADQYQIVDYRLFPHIEPAYDVSWPACDEYSVIVRLTAGKTSTYDKIGVALIKAIVADLFEHRESQSEISLTENKGINRLYNSFITR